MESSPKITFLTALIRWSGATILVMLAWRIFLGGEIHFQREQNLQHNLLISEKLLDVKGYEERQHTIENSRERLYIIASLRQQNDAAMSALTVLDQSVPLVQLTRLQWRDGVIQVSGYTHSDDDLTRWLTSLKTITWLHPVMTDLDPQQNLRYFQLKMRVN